MNRETRSEIIGPKKWKSRSGSRRKGRAGEEKSKRKVREKAGIGMEKEERKVDDTGPATVYSRFAIVIRNGDCVSNSTYSPTYYPARIRE